jgi:hypothetical protein
VAMAAVLAARARIASFIGGSPSDPSFNDHTCGEAPRLCI